jgi:hypothetical protein
VAVHFCALISECARATSFTVKVTELGVAPAAAVAVTVLLEAVALADCQTASVVSASAALRSASKRVLTAR